MTAPNPQHLIDQAEYLIRPRAAGPPRQADLRRAVSAAYYAVFHATAAAAADEFVGKVRRGTKDYALVYRSIDHRGLRTLCTAASRQSAPGKLLAYIPDGGFGPDITVYAASVAELQDARHSSDYDPLHHISASDAKVSVSTARDALARLANADTELRGRFLTLLLFQPR